MNNDLKRIRLAPVYDYNFANFFHKLEFNDSMLDLEGRKKVVSNITMMVNGNYESLKELDAEYRDNEKSLNEAELKFYKTFYSVLRFVILTMCDCMVAGKYFLIADSDYDKRYMRGKMKVLLNEGFKKLYGFKEEGKKKSEWSRLLSLMGFFPNFINKHYQDITFQLEKLSRDYCWWKNTRDLEIHLDGDKLFESRQKEINECKVMMESLCLFECLNAVSIFMFNANQWLLNNLLLKYYRGELTENPPIIVNSLETRLL